MRMKLKLLAGLGVLCIALTALVIWQTPSKVAEKAPEHVERPVKTEQVQRAPAWNAGAPAPMAADAPRTDLSAVPVSVRPIVDLKENPWTRTMAVRSLRKLSGQEAEALYAFLRQRNPEDETQVGHVIKNDLLDLLCLEDPLPDGLRELMTDMFEDRGQNVVIRDYALQHLLTIQNRLANAPGGTGALEQMLWGALAETDSSIAGTALIGLQRLAIGRADFDRERLSSSALGLIQDDAAELTQITALQVCAGLGLAELLPAATALASAGRSVPVRISAIGAVGDLGTQAELELIDGILAGNDDRVRSAAMLAARKIRQRLDGKATAATNL